MKTKTLYLLFITLTAAFGGFLYGFDTAVISGTIPLVRSQFALSPWWEGFFVCSAILIGGTTGAGFSGIISDFAGRKKAQIIAGLLLFISAYACGISHNEVQLIISRIIGGFGIGIISTSSPLYISEISPARHRGKLVAIFQFFITIGILIAYFSNSWIRSFSENHAMFKGFGKLFLVDEIWRGMFMAQMIPSGIFTLLLFFVPETPRFLVKQNNVQKAHKVLAKIAGIQQADVEISEIKNAINEEKGSFLELFKPGLRKALFVALALSLLSELSGITVVIYFAPDIFNKAGFSFGQALNGTVIIGLINVIFTLFVLWKVDSMGRRPLAFIGLAGVFACSVATAIVLYLGIDNVYILIALLCAFVAFFSFSLGPIKFIVMNEIFPTKIRGMAVSIATFTIWLANGSLILAFPPMRDFLGRNHEIYGVAGSFLLFAAFLFPGFFFIWKVMPETKGKSLEEIEKSWYKKS